MQIEDMITSTINARSGSISHTSNSTTVPQMVQGNPNYPAAGGISQWSETNTAPQTTSETCPSAAAQDKILEHEKAGTPTDVRDIHF